MKIQKYEPIIGLEIHVQLKTVSKMFCRCSADIWEEPPNTHVCPICLGLPGALPFPNREAIEKAVKVGLALNCKPQAESKFDRKNYFYPDLPKGFQISQYDLPFSEGGWVEIERMSNEQKTMNKQIGIIRAHLEEDTGKLLHATVNGKPSTLIDFNRSGIPLMEIVSAPDIRSAQEARMYAAKIQQIVRYLGVSDADMEKGSMRVEPNVSLRKIIRKLKTKNSKLPEYKVELKNINSFRSVEKAIEYEIKRQQELLDRGLTPVQETRGWDEVKLATFIQRTKEEAFDYRYFPEPDLPPLEISFRTIANLRKILPEMPEEKIARYIKTYQLSNSDVKLLARDPALANFFEEAIGAFSQTRVKGIKAKPQSEDAVLIANWVKGEVLANLNQLSKSITEVDFTASELAEIVYLVENGEITPQVGKIILKKWITKGEKPAKLIEELKVKRIPKSELAKIVKEVVVKNQNAVADFKSGKTQALSFLIGQVQRETSGKLAFEDIKSLLLKNLKSKSTN